MFTKKPYKPKPGEYWLTVGDCPIRVWRTRYEDGNSVLRKRKNNFWRRFFRLILTFRRYSTAKDEYAWEILFTDFSNRIGLDDDFVRYIEVVQRLVDLRYKYLKSLVKFQGSDIRNRKFLNQIHLLELEKEKLEKQGQTKLTSTEILEEITKAQGVLRNEDNTTVLQYFTLIKKLSKWHR
jgi:hypothetical protein